MERLLMINQLKHMKRTLFIYFVIIALTALALALSNDVLSNYFKDVYDVTTKQRGFIEFPRELPGVLGLVIISSLSFLGDIRVSMIAQFLSIIGILFLGFFTPSFAIMLVFIFINSVGMHMFFPLIDGIGLSLAEKEGIGKRMGQYKGVYTAFTMVGSMLVFVGFRTGIFSFATSIKYIFVFSAFLLLLTLFMLGYLNTHVKEPIVTRRKISFVFRKEYKYYYILTIMYGVQKQIMMVYGPWVLIELLGKKADTIAILSMLGAFAGVFFIPAVGRWLDHFGVKKILYADALSFIGVFLAYGFVSGGFYNGYLALVGLPVILAYAIFIADKMSNQMGMVRTLYLRSIALKKSDITPTLSMGISLDHIVSIICAYLGGIVWAVWGPQYVFYLAAGLSLVNLYVAMHVKKQDGFNDIEA